MRFFGSVAWIASCVISLLIWDTAYADDQEHTFVLEQQTKATYHSAIEQPPKAAVLLIHGWAGTLDEVGNLYSRLARQLGEQGIASIRVQIQGEFNTSGYRLTSTFASRVADAQRGLAYLMKTHPDLPLGVVGFSLGGATALALAGAHSEAIDSMVLWSSVVDPGEVEANYLTADSVAQILQQGELEITTYQPFIITKQHLLGMRGYNDLLVKFASYTGSLLMIRGTQDSVKMHEPLVMQQTNASPAEYQILNGADHIFQVLDPASHYDERVLQATTDWLSQRLIIAAN